MRKAQFTKLQPYEESFKEAKAGYYRTLLKSDVEVMAEVYEELGYKVESKNCNRCILGMLQNLAKEYDNYKNKHSKQDDTQH